MNCKPNPCTLMAPLTNCNFRWQGSICCSRSLISWLLLRHFPFSTLPHLFRHLRLQQNQGIGLSRSPDDYGNLHLSASVTCLPSSRWGAHQVALRNTRLIRHLYLVCKPGLFVLLHCYQSERRCMFELPIIWVYSALIAHANFVLCSKLLPQIQHANDRRRF